MASPHRVKAGSTREAEPEERAASALRRRRDRGRLLEEELRSQWDEPSTGLAGLQPRPDIELYDFETSFETAVTAPEEPAGREPEVGWEPEVCWEPDTRNRPEPGWETDAAWEEATIELPAVVLPPTPRVGVQPPPPPPPIGFSVDAASTAPDPLRGADHLTAGPPAGAASAMTAREAAIRFRRVAVAMALNGGSNEGSRADARDCATSLLALAGGGHEELLASTLRADPAAPEATWTVACYQIGDLSPSSLRDYAEAAPAVLALSRCETASHVAAELIVTNGDGVRWTAMIRSGSDVTYQPLAAATASAVTPAGLRAVRHRWEDRLLMWASDPAEGLDAPPAPPAPGDASPGGAGGAEQAAMGVVLGQVLEAVRHIEQRIPEPARPAADSDIHRRVTALEVTSAGLAGVRTDLERVRRRSDDLDDGLRQVHQRLAASEARVAQLDSRMVDTRRPAPAEPVYARPVPRGSVSRGPTARLARWMAFRLYRWSDRGYQGVVAPGSSPAPRRIELVAAEEWRSD